MIDQASLPFKITRIPNFYRPPLGLPLSWHDEQSGQLPAAVRAYFGHVVEHTALRPEELALVIEYIQHYANAPCWEQADSFVEELAELRRKAVLLKTVPDVRAFIRKSMEIGLDPL